MIVTTFDKQLLQLGNVVQCNIFDNEDISKDVSGVATFEVSANGSLIESITIGGNTYCSSTGRFDGYGNYERAFICDSNKMLVFDRNPTESRNEIYGRITCEKDPHAFTYIRFSKMVADTSQCSGARSVNDLLNQIISVTGTERILPGDLVLAINPTGTCLRARIGPLDEIIINKQGVSITLEGFDDRYTECIVLNLNEARALQQNEAQVMKFVKSRYTASKYYDVDLRRYNVANLIKFSQKN